MTPRRLLVRYFWQRVEVASRELHELHGLRDVHYQAGQAMRQRQQLERANDAPSVAPAI
jgi:hypothetical protein